jgi:Zn-dependent protease
MIRFSIFGIPVRVHPFFWLTLAIIGGALGADSPEAMFRILLFLLAGFISILVHELGHALTARKFGARSEIVLQAFGGYAAYSGVRMTRPQSFMITAAGPAVQIVLGLAVLLAIPGLRDLNQNALYFLVVLYWISLVWAVLNLLPVLPLDGGQMLNAILGPERIKTTLWVSIIVAVAAGLLLYLFFKSILALIFMGMFAWQAWQALRENRWR